MREALTEAFYRWERRGRGWQVWEVPVELEPPFTPFLGHAFTNQPVIDDGRRPTFLSSLISGLQSGLSRAFSPHRDRVDGAVSNSDEPTPDVVLDYPPTCEFHLGLPNDLKITPEASEQFLLSLTSCSFPVGFEIIGLPDAMAVQFVCREPDVPLVRHQLQAYFPGVLVTLREGFLERRWRSDRESFVVDFGLSDECMRPLRAFKSFEVDPLIAVTGALEGLRQDDLVVLQCLFCPARHPWPESMFRAVSNGDGDSFFLDAPDMLPLTKEKLEHPLMAALIRVGAQSSDPDRARHLVKAVGGALIQFGRPKSNDLIPLSNDDYPDELHEADLLARGTHRSGMLLNTRELISLVHLPSGSVRSDKLRRPMRKTKAAPAVAQGHKLVLGENFHQGIQSTVTLAPEQRLRHTVIFGATGTGKSSLLLNLLIQDIAAGQGVGLIDPHGDLYDAVLGHIPEERHRDVVLFDPGDVEYPIGFNILSAHSDLEATILSSDLVAIFKRYATTWGDQMTSVLGNAILAFLESTQGGTLLDLRRFLVEADFRKAFLATVKDREVVYYWEKEFPLLTGRPQASILTRLDTFLRPKVIRHMVAQKENTIRFADIFDRGKIFLARLAHGSIGSENAYLFGSFLVSKLHQAAMSRQERPESERRPFYLVIDEAHNFVTPSMGKILTEARKYGLGLTLASQEFRQWSSQDGQVAGAVLANPGTRVCFRLGEGDAEKLAEGFSFFDATDLQNLGVGEAICRIERRDYDFNILTHQPPIVRPEVAQSRRESLIAQSRAAYAVRRADLEEKPEQPSPAPVRSESAPISFPSTREAQDVESTVGKAPKKARAEGGALSVDEQRFLDHLAQHPGMFVTQLYAALGLSGYKGDKLKQGLMERGFITQEETRRGEGGRVAKVLRLTTPGAQTLVPPPGKGGAIHKDLQRMVKEQAELLGWKAKIEERIPASCESVDVGLAAGDLRVAVEISVTTDVEDELRNLEKCITSGYDYVISAVADEPIVQALRAKVRTRFAPDQRRRIRVCLPSEVKALLKDLGGPGLVSGASSEDRNQKSLLTVEEGAAFLGVKLSTLYGWVSQRKVPFVKVGRLTKFKRDALQAWLDRRSSKEENRDYL